MRDPTTIIPTNDIMTTALGPLEIIDIILLLSPVLPGLKLRLHACMVLQLIIYSSVSGGLHSIFTLRSDTPLAAFVSVFLGSAPWNRARVHTLIFDDSYAGHILLHLQKEGVRRWNRV
jgi:hypothetical protein